MKLVIFGCGKIANRVAKGALQVKEIDLVGFASKDIEKARAYSRLYGCKDYGDYEHFLQSDVDAVYIATYNPGHRKLIEKCIGHHKAVMCEKPMLFSVEENREVFELARKNDVLLMEALKSVFLPSILEVKRMVREKQIGEITKIYASFMRCGSHGEDHWINDLKTGGAFKDLGSYCIGTMNFILDRCPRLISLESDRSDTKAETSAHALLDYDGITGKASVSNSINGDTILRIDGTRGFIEVNNFWKQGKILYQIDGTDYEKQISLISDFYYELAHFAKLVDEGKKASDVMSEEASENILKITGQIG